MGITPITNLIPFQIARAVQADLEPLPMERVESSARTGDETYSPSGGSSPRGSEDDTSENEAPAGEAQDSLSIDEFSHLDPDDPADQSSYTPGGDAETSANSRPISFFA